MIQTIDCLPSRLRTPLATEAGPCATLRQQHRGTPKDGEVLMGTVIPRLNPSTCTFVWPLQGEGRSRISR
jgi:hypothetical protein